MHGETLTEEGRSPLRRIDHAAPALGALIRRSPARRILVALRHRGLTDSDVVLASYPRSGSTWLRYLLAELINDGAADRDHTYRLVPMVGRHAAAGATLPTGGRLVKTHERAHPSYHHVIYLARDPRDVARSCFVYENALSPTTSWDSFVPTFQRVGMHAYGSWTRHVQSYLDAADAGRDVTFIKYEDLVEDTPRVLADVARVCGITATPARITAAADRHRLTHARRRAAAEQIGPALLGRQFLDDEPRPDATPIPSPATPLDPTRRESLTRIVGRSAAANRLGYLDDGALAPAHE